MTAGHRLSHAVAVHGGTIRVVVVDDHPVVRDGVTAALSGRRCIEVVASAGSKDEAIHLVRELSPDVMLVDLHMPGGSGIEVLKELGRTAATTRCLVLTMDDDDDSLHTAMRAGACGYLLKGSRGEEIERAVRAAAAGEVVFGVGVAERVRDLFNSAPPDRRTRKFPSLTDRELDMLDLLARGQDNAAIARQLRLAPKTVRNQISVMLTKMGVADRAAAVAAARDAGLGRDDS